MDPVPVKEQPVPAYCDDPFIPQQSPGEPCNQSYECTTGLSEGGVMCDGRQVAWR